MFRKFKKGIISLSLAFAVMLSCCVPAFATIYENFYDNYKTYVYIDESVQPYHLAVGKGGDFAFRKKDNTYFEGFFADELFIHTISRNSSGNINGIQFSVINYTQHKIEVNGGSSFILYDYNLVESSFTHNYNSSYLYKFDWSKFSVSMSCGIEKGDSFTYLNYLGEEETITFDGQGGIVGYGNSNEDDNPFGDLTEEEYPDFSLPEFQGKELSEYVDFDSIIESIKGLDVAGAVQGLLGALKGGFKFTVDSVVNVVGYLTSTLKALFDWLKNTLPVLFNNFLVKLSPYFENLYNAIKDSPVGETLTDLTELYSKLDDLKAGLISVLPEPIQNVINSIPNKIAEIKEKIETVANNILSIKDTIIDRVQTIIDNIKDIPNKIDDFKEYFLSLFDTTNIDLSARVDNVKEYAFSKFPILSTISGLYSDIDSMLSSFSREPPVIVFPTSEVFGGEDVIVSLGFLRPVIAITDVIIVAACYLLTLIYSIRAIPNIIGGIGSGTSDLVNSFSSSAPTFEQLTFFDDK